MKASPAPDIARKIVYLRPGDERREALRRLAEHTAAATRSAGRAARPIWGALLFGIWQAVRIILCAVLVLIEPLLRSTLVPLAFLSFIVTVIFGFVIGEPRFPKWGMLAFSVGALLLYWLFLGIMSLFMRLPRDSYR